MTANESSVTGPLGGNPESAEWFRDRLRALGQSQTGLARLLTSLGDDRQPGTILRSVQRMANGEARVSGEMRALLTLLGQQQDTSLTSPHARGRDDA